jgi:shikimate kinase
MMGSGKTTIGELLAKQMGWPYFDNDHLLEMLRHVTPKELLADDGLAELRAGESQVLHFGLQQAAPCVVGAPAGTILDEASRRGLERESLVVWLTASPQTLARRARGAAHRPWLGTDAEAWMIQTLAERAPLYDSVANLKVDTERGTPEMAANEIAAWLDDRCP